eukprot:1155652-Pelagomonas_calceolata.AAC.5
MSVTQSFASPATPASSPPALLPLLQFQLQLYCFCCNPSNSPVVSACKLYRFCCNSSSSSVASAVVPVQALLLLLQLWQAALIIEPFLLWVFQNFISPGYLQKGKSGASWPMVDAFLLLLQLPIPLLTPRAAS